MAPLRQLHAGVQRGDGRVVPGLDLAHEDLGHGRTVELQLAGLDAFHVDHRHDAANDGRELAQTALLQVVGAHGGVGGAEVHGAGLDLGDAAAGADGLIVDTVASLLAEALRPLRQNGEDEARAGARDIHGVSGGAQAKGRQQQREAERAFHGGSIT